MKTDHILFIASGAFHISKPRNHPGHRARVFNPESGKDASFHHCRTVHKNRIAQHRELVDRQEAHHARQRGSRDFGQPEWYRHIPTATAGPRQCEIEKPPKGNDIGTPQFIGCARFGPTAARGRDRRCNIPHVYELHLCPATTDKWHERRQPHIGGAAVEQLVLGAKHQ